ncbi:ThuA domain-containing protein [Novosphingobium sp. JCM 18896]|uniref:ThuA domain-containing protein n=1 Tax=Novosphingobium sp. JCM 18896 TaxID=2989731 RepID=UPI002222FAAA|nr:ThuA domain-containing protein [Novosphingobium sp. JCM 18896]MCW1429498.1 ThuA domain-containing protein [Novosphingobium sp. JCM 18896]
MKTFAGLVLAAALAAGVAQPATARPVTDCPLRDAPFSVDSPLVDIMLSPAAKAVLEKAAPGRFSKLPPRFAGTTPPTFAAILSLREGSAMTGIKAEALPAIDAELRALPVTAADKVARCARYDNEVPRFDLPKGKPHLLLFEKINGFKDTPSVDAARAALTAMAERKGWALVVTDKGGAFNPATLRQFDAVIWNNISGDVLTLSQRRAFQTWIEQGGAYVGLHGSAGDFIYFWDWYADRLLGARFIGHPMAPQFQDARVVVQAPDHPAARGLPREWTMNDEWYSFRTNPRAIGATVIATLDETSYKPVGMMNQNLRMGDDHPIAWTNCVGKGRMFYSAIGHRPETYAEPHNVVLLEAAIDWAAVSGKRACPARR